MSISLPTEFYYRICDETENELFDKFNTCKDNITRNNNSIPLYKGEWVKIKVNDFLTHIVKPTQTLKDIGEIYHVAEQEIVQWNNLQNLKLFIGQHLKIYKKSL